MRTLIDTGSDLFVLNSRELKIKPGHIEVEM